VELCQKHMEKMDETKDPKEKEDEDEKFGAYFVEKMKTIPQERKFEAHLALMMALKPFIE